MRVTCWLKARRAGLLLAAMVTLTWVAVAAASRQVMMPTVLGGGQAPAVAAVFLPLPAAVVVGLSLSGRVRAQERVALRRTGPFDLLLVCLAVACACAAAVAAASVVGMGVPWGYLRNLLLLVAVTVSAGALTSPTVGSALAALVMVVAVSWSPRAPGARYVRLLHAPDLDLWAGGVCAVAVTLAVAVLLMDVQPMRSAAGSQT